MRNRFPGICYKCGKEVKKGAGHFERAKPPWRGWKTIHAECAIAQRMEKANKYVPPKQTTIAKVPSRYSLDMP